MLFRNPFRFGKVLPWKPAGKRKPVWSIDKSTNVLSLSGFVVDHIRYAAPYDESIFGNATIQSDKGNEHLKQILQRILTTIEESQLQKPFSTSVLTATASSFSFGLDDKSDPAAERHLLHNFVAYLKLVLDDEIYNKYRPADVSDEAKHANGLEFGKPVWDFTYPESSFFLTETGLVGCCVAATGPGAIIYSAFGSKYPFVLQPDSVHFLLRRFAYVHEVMHGERGDYEEQIVEIS